MKQQKVMYRKLLLILIHFRFDDRCQDCFSLLINLFGALILNDDWEAFDRAQS